ncbi:cache domain-containing protein [bacterium]|nr:cache domain-containing protein [bacterium]
MKIKIFDSLKTRIILLLVSALAITSLAYIVLTNNAVTQAIYHAQEESAKNNLRLIMLNIESEYKSLQAFKANSLTAHKQNLQDIISLHEQYIRGVYNQVQKGLINEEQAKQTILKKTLDLRYGNNDYIWISDYNSIMLSHPDNKLLGKDLSKLLDLNGKPIVSALVAIAQRKEQGFYTYWWKKLDTEVPVEKLAYVKLFPEWKWVISTGVYIDEIEKESTRRYNNMISDLKSSFSKIKIAETGFAFIFNGKKKMLLHPVLENIDFSSIKDPADGNFLANKLMDASMNPSVPLSYLSDKPSDKHHYIYEQQSFVKYFQPLDWYVATSMYKDELNTPARNIVKKIIIISMFLTLLLIVISTLFTNTLTKPIRMLISAMNNVVSGENKAVSVDSGGTIEIRELGELFNRMISSIESSAKDREKYAAMLEDFIIEQKSILDTAVIGIAFVKEGRLIQANKTMETMFAYRKAELINTSLSLFFTDKTYFRTVMEEADKIIKFGKVYNFEIQLRKKSGSLIWCNVSGKAVDPSHLHKGTLWIFADINARKEAESELKRTHNELENRVTLRTTELSRSNRLLRIEIDERCKVESDLTLAKQEAELANTKKSEFMANISHEIRTPLNGIIGFTESIFASTVDDNTRMQSEIILQESEMLLSLINELLDHAKIESGNIAFECNEFDLHQCLKQIDQTFHSATDAKGLSYITTIDDTVPRFVHGDMFRLKQILGNLVGNAIKFTAKGEIQVHVSSTWTKDNMASILFSVTDTGIGIAKDRQTEIFKSFTQADNSTTRLYGGTGLGTTISKQLVELLGGKIGLESEPGIGSKFWFSLTMQKSIQGSDITDADITINSSSTQYRNISILMAEDYDTNARVIMQHLNNSGHSLKRMRNGQEAVNEYENGSYDLILMDIQMPIMDGYEAARRIRASSRDNAKDIIIIAMTANADADSKQSCFAAGMNDVITKPVRRAHFLNTINKWLNLSSTPIDVSTNVQTSVSANPGKVSSIPINYELALEEFEGEKEVLDEVLKDFLSAVKQQLPILKLALEQNNRDIAKREAHKIKGGAANLVAIPLSKAAATLEKAANSLSDNIADDLFCELEIEYNKLTKYMNGSY